MKVVVALVLIVAVALAQRAVVPVSFSSDYTFASSSSSGNEQESGRSGFDLANGVGYWATDASETYLDCKNGKKTVLEGQDCATLDITPDECLEELGQFDFYAHGDTVRIGTLNIAYNITSGSSGYTLQTDDGYRSVDTYTNYAPYTDEPVTCLGGGRRNVRVTKTKVNQLVAKRAASAAACNRLACAAKIAVCGVVCYGSLGTGCVLCLGGATGCISCFRK